MARRNKLNKKGSIQDLLFIGITLVAIAIIFLIGFKINDEINDKIQATDQFETRGKESFNTINNLYPGVIDNGFLLLMVGLSIGALILASLVKVHPIFIVFFLILLVIIIFLAGVFSNIYQEAAGNADMIDVANRLKFTSFIMQGLPFIVGVLGSILAIVLYKTWQGTGGGL